MRNLCAVHGHFTTFFSVIFTLAPNIIVVLWGGCQELKAKWLLNPWVVYSTCVDTIQDVFNLESCNFGVKCHETSSSDMQVSESSTYFVCICGFLFPHPLSAQSEQKEHRKKEKRQCLAHRSHHWRKQIRSSRSYNWCNCPVLNPLLSLCSIQMQFTFTSCQKDEAQFVFFSCPLKAGATKWNCPIIRLQIT